MEIFNFDNPPNSPKKPTLNADNKQDLREAIEHFETISENESHTSTVGEQDHMELTNDESTEIQQIIEASKTTQKNHSNKSMAHMSRANTMLKSQCKALYSRCVQKGEYERERQRDRETERQRQRQSQ